MATFYVNSAADAGGDGSYYSPFATLSDVLAVVASNDTIKLKAGSEWREQLDLYNESVTGVTVVAYGAVDIDGLPVIRGDDVLSASWDDSTARVDAHTNVYSQDITLANGSGATAQWPAVWKDDSRLVWADTIADVNSTAGTFTLSGGAGDGISNGTYTLYIHPQGSTNPNSDGATYEASVRPHGVTLDAGSTCTGVWGRRATHNNGPFWAQGLGCQFRACLGDGGVRHQMLMVDGIYNRCIAWSEVGSTDSRSGQILMEFYTPDGSGLTGTYTECMALSYQAPAVSDTGFGGHTSGDSGDEYERWSVYDCTVKGCNFSGSVGTKKVDCHRLYSDNGGVVTLAADEFNLVDYWSVASGDGWQAATGSAYLQGQNSAANITIDGWRHYSAVPINTSGSNLANFSAITGRISFARSVISDLSDGLNTANAAYLSLPVDYEANVNGVVIEVPGPALTYRLISRTGGGPTGATTRANNVYYADSNDTRDFGATYGTQGAYLTAAQALSLEAGSVAVDPGVNDPAIGDFSLTGSGLPALAGLERPSPGYLSYMRDIPATIIEAEAWVIERFSENYMADPIGPVKLWRGAVEPAARSAVGNEKKAWRGAIEPEASSGGAISPGIVGKPVYSIVGSIVGKISP